MTENNEQKITLDKKEYDEIVHQLEKLSKLPPKKQKDTDYKMAVLSRVFWDTFFSKIFASLVSVKIWILFSVLYWPYDLVKKGLISGDNYTNIVIVVAPLVVGLREYAKASGEKKTKAAAGATEASEPNIGQKFANFIKQKFHI